MNSAADILANKKKPLITIPSDQSIQEALVRMTSNNVGAILVTDEDESHIVGIWTERDLMNDVLKDNFDIRSAVIGEYMTSPLHSAPHDATLRELKDMFLGLFIRHLLIKQDGENIGLLSLGDAVRASLLAQDQHIRDLKAKVSWQYYESWGWERPRT